MIKIFHENIFHREFCNEIEPKEGLDDSYEEHDLSNTKSSSGSSTQPLVISVACEDKENFPIQLFLPTDQVECKEIQASAGENGNHLAQCELEMDNSINTFQAAGTEKQTQEIMSPNGTIYFDDGMDITSSIQPQIIFAQVQEDICEDTLPVSQTYVEDVPTEIKENLLSILPKKILDTKKTNQIDNFECSYSNSTEPISTILGMGQVKKLIESQSTKFLPQHSDNETECFTDMPLEFTSVIPSSTWIKPRGHFPNNDETERLNGQTMEFTEVVQLQNIVHAQKYGQSTIFPQQENQDYQGKNYIPGDNSRAMKDASLYQNQIQQIGNTNHNLQEKPQEKTNIYSNASIEITEAVPVCNEMKKLQPTKTFQEETLQEKTKIFCDQSMEITGLPNNNICQLENTKNQIQKQEITKFFINTSMEMTEVIPSHNKINECVGSKNKLLTLDANKTKVFFNTSMEMTEAVPTHEKFHQLIEVQEKTYTECIQNKTKVFNDNSMEITEAFNCNNIKIGNHCKPQFIAQGNEKTQLFHDVSMEMTEAVPVIDIANEVLVTADKIHEEITQDRTKLFQDKSMEVTEAVMQHNRCSQLSGLEHNTLGLRQENTKFCFNASMELTEGVSVLLSKMSQPISNMQKIQENTTFQNTQFNFDKSMEITEAVPVCHLDNPSIFGKENIQKEIIQDRTKIFQNKSMEVTEPIFNYNETSLLCHSKNKPSEQALEKTKFFNNTSMEITEAIPIVNRMHQFGSEFRNVVSKNIPEQTEIFQNKSMEITEAITNISSNNYRFEKSMDSCKIGIQMPNTTNAIQSCTSVTETIPVDKEIWRCEVQNNEALSKHQSQEIFENDRVHVMSSNVLANHEAQVFNFNDNNKSKSESKDERTRIFNNKSMDFTEILPQLGHHNIPSYIQNNVSNLVVDKDKPFFNNSMDTTAALKILHQQESTLPDKTNIQNSNSINNTIHLGSEKDNACNQSTYRDKSFQRMTTDELNTLCASMNLPTQNYTTERSSILKNDYIPICNDVNVLRDSLQKNYNFQQNFTIGTDISTPADNNMHIPANVSGNSKKTDDLTTFRKTHCDSERSMTLCTEKSQNFQKSTEVEFQKEYDPMHEHNFKEGNAVSELKSRDLDSENLEYENVFSNLIKSTTPINSNDAECFNSEVFRKQSCGMQTNSYSLDKNETLRNHNVSESLSDTQKSCIKRKSIELDENNGIPENSLTRLSSDNTEFLIATMGVRTKLSHPLIINEQTTMKIPRLSSEKIYRNQSSTANETISTSENGKCSKNIASSLTEVKAFRGECSSSNEKNECFEAKKCTGKTESFLENSANEIDGIQPPSFLCSDSLQTDSMVEDEILDNESVDLQDQIDSTFEKQCYSKNDDLPISEDCDLRKTKRSFEKDFLSTTVMDKEHTTRHANKENNEPVEEIVSLNISTETNESMISLINEEIINTDPLAPFSSLTKSIELHEKRYKIL